jgi:hypothetical protein
LHLTHEIWTHMLSTNIWTSTDARNVFGPYSLTELAKPWPRQTEEWTLVNFLTDLFVKQRLSIPEPQFQNALARQTEDGLSST